jgi:hypothetical protein
VARWAIYESATGRLVADTARQPLDLRPGLAAVSVPDSDEGLMWDATTRAYIARPPKVLIGTTRDRFHVLQQDARFTGLNATTRTRVLELVTAVFNDVRFA